MTFRRTTRTLTPVVLLAAAMAGCTGAPPTPAPSPGQVGLTALMQMTTPRSNHAAILLHDGRVLICGGSSTNQIGGVLASAELYDGHGFVPTGAMSVPRMGHTLTMLGDGRVLAIGGLRNVGFRAALASAEIYDPATASFTPTGSMSTTRENFTATLLRDGRVLMVGGSANGVDTISSAELYDPRTGKFRPTGHLNQPRESHAATLLSSGGVLITGGARSDRPGGYIAYDTAEIYDPVTDKFSFAARMVSDRLGQTSTMLDDGAVLVAGGRSSHVVGRGFAAPRSLTALKSAEVFDPEIGQFRAVGSMQIPRFLQTATLLNDGSVLMVGGWTLFGAVAGGLTQAERYDPLTRAFTSAGSTQVGRLTHTATLLPDGEVLVAGGVDALSKVTASVEFYNPRRREFALRPASEDLSRLPME